jgi:diaminopimelate decarboxylase
MIDSNDLTMSSQQINQNEALLWWQREDLNYQNGELFFADFSVEKLARQFGTPSFVYSAQRVKSNMQRIHTALNKSELKGRFSLLYAMKANRFTPLLTFMKQTELCGIDACSPNEVELAVSCGFKPEEISFTATSLSNQDFDILARYNGISMNCDSIHAITQWGKRKPGSEIGIRVNPAIGIGRNNNDKLHYSGSATSKFGIYQEQFKEALSVAKSYQLKVTKIHFHTGCGYLTEQLNHWQRILKRCQWFIGNTPDIRTVNVGGGLGVPHLVEDAPLDLDNWVAILQEMYAKTNLQIEIEPGDYIVKDAGILLLSKTFVEKKQTTLFVGVDAGFNIAPEPAHYSLPFQPLSMHWKQETSQRVHLVGHINEALDVWYENALLPDIENQDFIALINSGAYSSSMASNHCMRGQFKEFLLFPDYHST